MYWNAKDRSWTATIRVDGKAIYLGAYLIAKDAGIAYNHAAKEHFGEFAAFNDIPGWEAVQPIRKKRIGARARKQMSATLNK